MVQFDEHIFQMGWLVQPPTSYALQCFLRVVSYDETSSNMAIVAVVI